MIKILSYLFSYFAGRYNSILKPSTFLIIDQLLMRTRKLVMTSSIMFISSLLLSAGVIISLIEFTSQIDRFGVVWPSATLIGGLTLSVIALGVLIFSFTSKSFDLRYIRSKTHRRQESLLESHQLEGSSTKQQRAQSPLEEALGVLIMDFVNERKQNREQAAAKSSETPAPVPPQSDYVRPETTARASYENTTLQ